MMSPGNDINHEKLIVLTTLVGAQTVFGVTIVISLLVLFLYIRKKLMFLQNQITTVSLLLTQKDTVDEDVCKNCDETDKIDDAAVINHVINEESAKPLQNKFKEIDEVTKPKGKRKMCKSDSELSFRNKVLITTKPKADQKKPTLYEKCRLPFETCDD